MSPAWQLDVRGKFTSKAQPRNGSQLGREGLRVVPLDAESLELLQRGPFSLRCSHPLTICSSLGFCKDC
jgi:hypothetical protein